MNKTNLAGLQNKNILVAGVVLLMAAVSLLVVLLGPWVALAAIFSLALIYLAFYRTELVIFFLALYIPLEPFLLKFISDDIYVYARYFSEGLIYILLLSVFIQIVFQKKKFVFTPIDAFFIGFLFISGISILANRVDLTIGVLGIRQVVRFILFYYVVVYTNPRVKFIRFMATALLLLVFLESLLGIAQGIIGEPLDRFLIPSERKFFESIQLTTGTTQFWESGQRVFGTLGRYDQLGTFLSFFMLLAVGWLYQLKNKQNKKALFFILIIGFIALLLTYSRASWFGFLFGLIFIGLFIKRDRRVFWGLAILILIILGYLLYSGIAVHYLIDVPSQTVVERFFEAFSYERWRGEYLGLGRLFFIVKTITAVFPSSPIFGVGPGQYGGGAVAALRNTTAYDELGLPFGIWGTEGYIDNNWFSILGETGILGIFFYAGMLVILLRNSLWLYKNAETTFAKGLALGYAGAVISVAFEAFLAQHLESRTLAIYLWMFGAFIVVLNSRVSTSRIQRERTR